MDKKNTTWALVLIQWVMAFIWLQAGWEKWSGETFTGSFAKTIGTFATKTPYKSYADFLTYTVLPSASTYANLVRTGELCVGLALAIGGIFILRGSKPTSLIGWLMLFGLLVGAFLNLNFYLAAGWSGPSTAGLNMFMGLTEIILLVAYLVPGKSK